MHTVPVLALIVALAAKALLRAHHGPPRRPWEHRLTVVAAGLTVVTVIVLALDALDLTGSGGFASPTLTPARPVARAVHGTALPAPPALRLRTGGTARVVLPMKPSP